MLLLDHELSKPFLFQAWAQAVAATQTGSATPEQKAKGSSWPILLFFGVIAAAPYIVLKMLNGLTSSIHEKCKFTYFSVLYLFYGNSVYFVVIIII